MKAPPEIFLGSFMKVNDVLLLSFFFLILCGCSVFNTGNPVPQTYRISKQDIREMIYISEVHWAGSVDNNGANYNPDDVFIELGNSFKGPIDISGWAVVLEGSSYAVIKVASNTVLFPGSFYTIGNNTNGAFPHLSQIEPHLKMNRKGFNLSVYDGGQKCSDSLHFSNESLIPAGYDLPGMKRSMVRVTDYFGPVTGDSPDSWVSYDATFSATNVSLSYNLRVFASPGLDAGGIVGNGGSQE